MYTLFMLPMHTPFWGPTTSLLITPFIYMMVNLRITFAILLILSLVAIYKRKYKIVGVLIGIFILVILTFYLAISSI